ncbi:MAG TPA: alpha/beta hydrolase [Stellaceae bacterium]|nr:alpha/beta hydrolase [Stellaceae bacterium]
MLAAGETPSGRLVRFAVTIGGYYDIDAAIGFATTGAYRAPDGSWVRAAPNDYGAFVFLRGNAERLRNQADRALLTAIAERRLADPAADISSLVARLGPEGGAVYALVANRDPLLVPALIARLPEAIRVELRRLDLEGRALPFLAGPVFVVHGEDDTMIPAGESAKLAAALGRRAELYVVERFAHVDAGTATLGDSLRLWNAAIRILEERDRS